MLCLWYACSSVQHILCCIFCFVLGVSSSCVPYVASFSGLSIFDCPSIFSNVYLIIKQHKKTKRDDCGPQTCFGTCFR